MAVHKHSCVSTKVQFLKHLQDPVPIFPTAISSSRLLSADTKAKEEYCQACEVLGGGYHT